MSESDSSIIVAGIASITKDQIISSLVIPGFFEHRDKTLAEAKECRVVFDDETNKKVQDAYDELRQIRLGMEKATKFRKDPIAALAKKVQATSDEVMKDVFTEEPRLKTLLENHQIQLRKKEQEAQRKRDADAEIDRLAEQAKQAEIQRRQKQAEDQAKDAQKAIDDAETERQNALRQKEAAEKAVREANSPEAIERARRATEDAERATAAAKASADAAAQREREAQQNQEAAELLALESEEFNFGASSQTVEIVPVVAFKGREKWDFEEMEVLAFARQFPDLVTMTIKRQVTLDAINAGTFDRPIMENAKYLTNDNQLDDNTVRVAPGLRIFKTVKI